MASAVFGGKHLRKKCVLHQSAADCHWNCIAISTSFWKQKGAVRMSNTITEVACLKFISSVKTCRNAVYRRVYRHKSTLYQDQ